MQASAVRLRKAIELSQTPKRIAREAQLEIRAISVTVKPPHAHSFLPQVTYNVVLVEEVNSPEDGTDVCWLWQALAGGIVHEWAQTHDRRGTLGSQ